MIYCTRSSTNYNECSLPRSSFFTLPHHEWIYACHIEQREKTTTFDVCYLLSIYIYVYEYTRMHLFLFSYHCCAVCICIHIISLKRKFDVNVLQCDTTHHHVLRNEMTSKRWNEIFCIYIWCVTSSCALCTVHCHTYIRRICVHTQRNIVQHNVYLVMPHAAYCYHHYLQLFMDSLWLYGFE